MSLTEAAKGNPQAVAKLLSAIFGRKIRRDDSAMAGLIWVASVGEAILDQATHK